MPLSITGQLDELPRIRAGFIGCGSHAFRNIFPTFQFAPVELVATCDLTLDKAAAFAKRFGASRSYSSHHEMLEKEKLDAVFIVTNYDEAGRPRYVGLAKDCVAAGAHVWMEKPPAATVEELQELETLAGDLNVMVGFKKMFIPANEKAHALASDTAFGKVALATIQYPQQVPPAAAVKEYLEHRRNVPGVTGFLDHLCHPVSLLIFLMGMPQTLFYQCTKSKAAVATFGYDDGRLATLTLSHGTVRNGGMERTQLISETEGCVLVENNWRVTLQRDVNQRGYGGSPDFYTTAPEQTSAVWEPEFSLGQLYNKGLFLLGYFGEVNEFAKSILEKRPLSKCHLKHAQQVTRIFTAFAEDAGKVIVL